MEHRIVTPEMAREWLDKCNTKNRNMSEKTVAKYVAIIKRGEWRVTAQGVSFDTKGRLSNGQHRLEAIARSGIPVEMVVVYNEPDDAYMVNDQGKNRRLKDHLDTLGHENTTIMASSAYALREWASGTSYRASVDQQFALRFLALFGQSVAIGAKKAADLYHRSSPYNKAATSAFYTLVHQNPSMHHHLNEYFARIKDGYDLSEGNPIGVVRRQLVDPMIYKDSRAPTKSFALLALGWNDWIANKQRRRVYSPDMPEAIYGAEPRGYLKSLFTE